MMIESTGKKYQPISGAEQQPLSSPVQPDSLTKNQKIIPEGNTGGPEETPICNRDAKEVIWSNLSDIVKVIPVNSTREKDVEDSHWKTAQSCLCSIISRQDLFQLTGNSTRKALIEINGIPHMVVSDSALEPGQIIINPQFQEGLPQKTLQLSSCLKQPNEKKAALINIECISKPDDLASPVLLDQDSPLKTTIGEALQGMPCITGQKYSVQSSYFDKNTDDYFWLTFQFTATPPAEIKIEQDDKSKPETIDVFSTPESLKLLLSSRNGPDIILKSDTGSNERSFSGTWGVSMNPHNFLELSQAQFRHLKADCINDSSGKILVELNGYYYYAAPVHPKESFETDFVSSALFPDETEKTVKITASDIQLKPAKNCTVTLSWHRHYRGKHNLEEEDVKKLIRKELHHVPIQNNKRFKVQLMQPDSGKLFLEGLISGVSGSDSDSSDIVFSIDDSTDVHYNSTDPAIFTGCNPIPRSEDEIIKIMVHRLAGAEHIARKIARKVITPFRQPGGEKGIILHGPPGTGKSVLSKNIGKALQALEGNTVYISPGTIMCQSPEESVKKLQQVFETAFSCYRNKCKEPFVFVIDEFDTMILPKRRHEPPSPVQAALCSELQTILDGGDAETPNNFILIVTTNMEPARFGEALIRQGRLSVQVEMRFPDSKQRKEILGSALQNKSEAGWDITSLDIEKLTNITENKSGKDIVHLVNSAILVASQETFINGDSSRKLNMEHFGNALYCPDAISFNKNTALAQFPVPDDFQATEKELEAVNTALKTVNRMSQGSDLKGIILVNLVPHARSQAFCRMVIEGAKGFDNFRGIQNGMGMIGKAFLALESAKHAGHSLIVIDRADHLVEQETQTNKADQIGYQWELFRNFQYKSCVLLLTCEKLPSIKQPLGWMKLESPRKTITLAARASVKEMKDFLVRKYKVEDDKANQIVGIFDKGCPFSLFKKLTTFYKTTSEAGATWDTEEMKTDYCEQKHQEISMFM